MEKNAFSPPSETNTASPNSPPPPLAMALGGARQCFSENLPETRDFGAEFFSLYRAIFPPKSSPLPCSLSLTPSTRSSSAGGGGGCDYEDESATEHRLMQARLILEHQQLNDHYDLCQTHLLNLNKEIEILRRENDELRSVNDDLLKILSSPTAFQSFLLSSGAAYPNRALLDSFRRLDVGGVLAPDHGHGGEDVTDISPTSVMETNRFERPSAERVSLPKSISVRSTGYQKVISQSPGNSSREGPSRSSNRPRSVPNQTVSGTQRVFVPGVGEKEEESGGLELEVYNQGMFKTELCNKWQQTGTCPYGEQCQFAHGITELRPVIRHPRYKTEICRMVLSGDRCPYGHRCHFRHSLTEQERLLLPR